MAQPLLVEKSGHDHIPLKVPNVEFDFDVKFLMYVLGNAFCQKIQIH